jgi:hypothetical protein
MESASAKIKLPFIISMTIIGVAVVFLIIAGYLSFMPVNVVKANTQPYKVITPVVKAGDPIIYVADVCKYKEVSSLVSRTFIDENNVHYPLPNMLSTIPVGCTGNKVVVPTLPTFHSGKWHLSLDVEYRVNILRSQTYHFYTETFVIDGENK